jgi:PAS domain S-box-containing protein
VLISRVRWAGVALALAQAFLVDPAPISRPAGLGVALAIGLYNAPASFGARLPKRLFEPVVAIGLVGDLLACTAWLLLDPQDAYHTTFLVYILVAMEAAVLYGSAGTLGFVSAYLTGLALQYWEEVAILGNNFPVGVQALRATVVLLVAGTGAAMAAQSSRLRADAQDARRALVQEREARDSEASARRQADDALRASEERVRAVLANAPLALFVVDHQGVVTVSEGRGLAALGRRPEDAVGWSIQELYRHDPSIAEKIREALSGNTIQATTEEAGRSFAMSFGPFRDEVGHTIGAIGVAVDVTERRQAERLVGERTALYEALLSAQSGLGDLVVLDDGERLTYANAAALQVTGYGEAELRALPSFAALIPDSHRATLTLRDSANPPRRFETAIRHKDGHLVPLEAAQISCQIDARPHLFTMARDITDRKRIEKERQALLNRIVTVQEEQRRRIAGDIHDDSIQTMYAVKLRLHHLRAHLPTPQQAMLTELDQTLDVAVGRLRHLLFELRPAGLDQDGLAGALRQYLDQMRSESGLQYQLDALLASEPPDQTRVTVYRIAQEALTNVRKHARASRLELSLADADGGVLVRIEDNGHGFLVDQAGRPQPGHLGLSAMRERAELVGGWLRLESQPGRGTRVEFWVPVEPGAWSEAA